MIYYHVYCPASLTVGLHQAGRVEIQQGGSRYIFSGITMCGALITASNFSSPLMRQQKLIQDLMPKTILLMSHGIRNNSVLLIQVCLKQKPGVLGLCSVDVHKELELYLWKLINNVIPHPL